MSARPRPVTATFKPQSMDPPTGVRTRSYSLSSGGSTESLLSILNHSSVENLSLCEDQPQETNHTFVIESKVEANQKLTSCTGALVQNNHTRGMQKHNKDQENSNRATIQGARERQNTVQGTIVSVTTRPRRNQPDNWHGQRGIKVSQMKRKVAVRSEPVTKQEQPVDAEIKIDEPAEDTSLLVTHYQTKTAILDHLSAWEQWLVEKTKQHQEETAQEEEKRKKEEEETYRKKEEKEALRVKEQKKFQEWLHKKEEEMAKQARKEHRKTEFKKKLEADKKKIVEEKSKSKFEEWLLKKKIEDQRNKRLKKEIEKEENQKKEEQRRKSEEAVKKWMKEHKQREEDKEKLSFGYAGGKLTGYYDRNAPTTPTYYNPVPWIPVDVPQPKTSGSIRNSRRYLWNPDKYR